MERAMAASTSMTKLIQRSWIMENGLFPRKVPERMTMKRHEMLQVSWNWTNFLQLSKMLRPHLTALTTVEKLSLRIIMSA